MVSVAPRFLVFDLDGTLIDSSLDLCNSVNAALESVGRLPLPKALIASYIGDGAAMLVRRALGDPGDLDALEPSGRDKDADKLFHRAYEHFFTYYRAHKLDNTLCYDGVLEALTQIRSLRPSLPMAILTNKPVDPSRAICSALGLTPFFFQIYGGNSFETKKPDPIGLLKLIDEASALLVALGQASLVASDVVMIGDSDVDVITARRCGGRSIGCSYGLAPAALAAAEPDTTVAHPSEWLAALGF